MASWDQNDVSCDGEAPIRDWKVGSVTYPVEGAENNIATLDDDAFILLSISTSKIPILESDTMVKAI